MIHFENYRRNIKYSYRRTMAACIYYLDLSISPSYMHLLPTFVEAETYNAFQMFFKIHWLL